MIIQGLSTAVLNGDIHLKYVSLQSVHITKLNIKQGKICKFLKISEKKQCQKMSFWLMKATCMWLTYPDEVTITS